MIRRIALVFALLIILAGVPAAHANGGIVWTPTNGPTGGLVNALAFAPSAPGLIYAGTNGGVYVSRDDGARWQPVSHGLPDDPTITALAVSHAPARVFAGTHSGVYHTRDGGAHWAITDPRFADQFILALLIDPRNPNLIYAGTTTTILRSDNDGDTWNDVGKDLHSARVWALALSADGAAIYAATDAGVHVSRDRGAHWQSSSEGLPEGARPQAIAVTARHLLVGATQGLFRSKDGKTWSAADGAWSKTPIRALAVDARQPDRVFAITGQGIAKSSDGGTTWTLLPSPSGDAPTLSLAPGDKNALYVGAARGLWKTGDDGKTWETLNSGLVSTSVHIALFTPGAPLLAATRYGLSLSQNGGVTWREARGLTDPYVLSLAVDPGNPQLIYVGTWGSSVFISTDGGENFTRLTENLAQNAPISSLAVLRSSEGNPILYAGTLGKGLFRSIDGGAKWVAEKLGEATRVTALAFVSPWLYAGTERGLYRLDLSNASGTWQVAAATLPVDETPAVVALPRQPQTLLVGFASNGLYRSDDNGAQWRRLGGGTLPERARLQTLAFNPGAERVLYAGTNRGVYRSEDGGDTWAAANDGLPSLDVLALAVDPQTPEHVFAGTNGNGVVRGVDQFKIAMPTWLPFGVAGGIAALLLLGLLALNWRSRWSAAAQERTWARDWQQWEPAITQALWAFGQADESNLGKLPRRQRVRALQYYVEQHPEDALTLQAAPVALKLDNYPLAQKFLSHWKAAWETVESEDAFKSVTSHIVDQLCALLGFTRLDERAYKGLIGYVVKAPALRLKIPPRFPIIFIPHHEPGDQELATLRDLMGVLNMVSYFALVVDLRDEPALRVQRPLKRLVRETIHDFIVLDGNDIRDLIAARDRARRLVDIILHQVDLTVISPYVTSGPVPANMFFGREHELKTIVRTARDVNFAIVGGRKIGKTSVLARVHQLLQEAPEYQPLYLDCQAIHSSADFFEAVDTMWKMSLPAPTPEGFRRVATEFAAQFPALTTVLLLDEIDELIAYDTAHGEHLFRVLRALAQESHLRFVFCGEKVLNDALHNPRLVFFNFCNLMPLSYLSPDEARRVVLDPMHEMGITLEGDGALADEIVELTAGHPNIVQFVCQKLIERINQRRERLITRADLQALSQSTQFAEYFAEVTWGNANALERLVTLLMLEQPAVTIPEMAEILRGRGLNVAPIQLEAAFDGLCLYSILRRDGPKYAFTAPTFSEVLRRSQDVYGLILSYTEEIKKSNELIHEPV